MTKSQTKKNTTDIEKLLASHQEHLLIANQEMGVVKTDISWLKESRKEDRVVLDRVDSRGWWILGTIVLGFLISIYLK